MLGVVSSMMKEKMSAFGSCDRELPSILVRDAAMLAATLCRVMRGLPLMEAGPLVRFQDVSAATLAAAGAAPTWALETDRILLVSEFCGPCVISSWLIAGPGMGVLLNCFVSPCAPGGFWIETDFSVSSVMFLSEDCSSRFQGERTKLTEVSSLLSAGYVFSSQVMYGIQEAAAACLLVACAGLQVLFVGWQPQLAACMMICMLALSRVREFMKLKDLFGSSVMKGFFHRFGGRVASRRRNLASSGSHPHWPVGCFEVSNSLSGHCLDCLLAERVGVPVGSFYVLSNGRVWRDGVGLQREDTLQMVGRLLGGARQPPVIILGQLTCTSCGMEGCWPSKMRCFRCLAPRPDGNGADSSRPVFGKGNARERSYPGQPAVSRNPTNPTIRHVRNAGAPAPVPPGPVAPEAPPMVDLSDAATIAKVLSLLASLGVSDVLL